MVLNIYRNLERSCSIGAFHTTWAQSDFKFRLSFLKFRRMRLVTFLTYLVMATVIFTNLKRS